MAGKNYLNKAGESYVVHNPTPYYITIVDGLNGSEREKLRRIYPYHGSASRAGKTQFNGFYAGASPVLSYINDYGGRPRLKFSCDSRECKVIETDQGN